MCSLLCSYFVLDLLLQCLFAEGKMVCSDNSLPVTSKYQEIDHFSREVHLFDGFWRFLCKISPLFKVAFPEIQKFPKL